MIYFTSDQHFDHINVIKYCTRPFNDVNEMNEALIENYNKRVKPNDICYILGDVMMHNTENARNCLRRLHGHKYLVRGNHDPFKDNDPTFEWVKDYFKLRWNHTKFILCHYPFISWNGSERGSYHLHGHQHNIPEYNITMRIAGTRRYDVGVDANDFKPVSIEEIIVFFEEGDTNAQTKETIL